ncbi:MAG: hypothetical protein WBE68_08630, partial [Candidatus Nitrosopolaris sp.]
VLYLGLPNVLSIAQTTGIIATMVLTFYYYRQQIQSLNVNVETKVLNDLDEKVHSLNTIMIEHPDLGKVMTNFPTLFLETTYSFDVLNMWSHAYEMHERKVLSENEWNGWLYWMRSCFREGTIKDHWKQFERTKWFDLHFLDFINRAVMPGLNESRVSP